MADNELDALLDEYGDWETVALALEERLEGADDDAQRVESWKLLAQLKTEHFDEAAAAAELLEQALELAPEDGGALALLADAYEKVEDWEALTHVLIDLAGTIDDPADKSEALRRAANVYADHLDQFESAQLVLRKAMTEAPLDQVNWAAAETLWNRLEDPAGLAELLNEHAAVVAEMDGELASVPLIVAVARAHRAAGSSQLAEAFLARAALIDENDDGILREQVEVQHEAEHWDALAESLEKLAERTVDGNEEAALRRRLGRVRFEQLEDIDGAIAAFERAHQLHYERDDAETLGALYESTDRWSELAGLLTELADIDDDAGVRVARLVRVAEIRRDRLNDAAAAQRTFEEVLEQVPAHEGALAAIASLLEDRGDTSGLVDHLRRWAGVASDEERPSLLLRRAELQEGPLGDPAAAIVTLQELQVIDDTVEGCCSTLLRLLEAAGRTEDAVAVHVRLAELAADDADWRTHMMAAAAGYRTLAEFDEATAAYSTVLQRQPGDAEALAALEALQTEAGDVAGAIDSLRRRVEVTEDAAEKTALLLRLANLQRADDPSGAAASFRAVLEIDGGHATALGALAECYEALEDWTALSGVLEQRVERERDLHGKAGLLARLADVLDGRLGDAARARATRERAVELDPGCVAAARPLADAYLEEEAWERARPLLEALVAAIDDEVSAEERHVLHLDLAAVSDLLGLSESAIAEYEAALDASPSSVQSLLALGRLYAGAGRDADADRVYRSLVLEQLGSVPEDGHVELFTHAGEVAAKVGDSARAADLFKRALAIDEFYEPALRALAVTDDTGGDPRKRLEARQSLLQLTDDPKERVRLLLEIGDAFVDLDDSEAAAEAYGAAREIEPESKAILHKLLAVHTAAERWEDAASSLVGLAKLETDASRRDKFLFAVGAIYRDQLSDVERAAAVFRELLDGDPTRLDAFDALESLFEAVGAWKRLQEEYRLQLERLVDRDDVDALRFRIVRALAFVYRDHLGRPDDAIDALRVASNLDPKNVEVLEAIADIYPKDGKSDDAVIAEHRAIVNLVPGREDSHHVLFAAFKRERRFDEAWNEAAILTVLGSREKGPTEFYAEHRPPSVPLARRGLSRDEWRLLQHPDLSVEATRLLAAIAATLRRVYSIDVKNWGVNRRKDWIDVSKPNGVVNLFHYSAQVLGVAMPALLSWAGDGFQNANAEPRAVLVSKTLLESRADRRIVFRIARTMCLMRNEFYLASAVSPATLVPLVQATISLFTGGPPKEWDSEQVRAWMTAIADEPDEILTALGEAVAAYVQSGQSLNLRAWPRAVELTAGRVALLVCGDVQRAAQASQEVPRPLGDVDLHERVLDLVHFAASDDYAQLRGELGLGIGQS